MILICSVTKENIVFRLKFVCNLENVRKLFLSENTKFTIDFVIVEQETAFVPTEKTEQNQQ